MQRVRHRQSDRVDFSSCARRGQKDLLRVFASDQRRINPPKWVFPPRTPAQLTEIVNKGCFYFRDNMIIF